MSISITCPSCGTKANAADAAAGKRAKCRKCGAAVQIPALVPVEAVAPTVAVPSLPPKLCASCGADVSHQKRVKDDLGNYYCHPCWAANMQPPPAMEPVPAVMDAIEATPAVDETPEPHEAEELPQPDEFPPADEPPMQDDRVQDDRAEDDQAQDDQHLAEPVSPPLAATFDPAAIPMGVVDDPRPTAHHNPKIPNYAGLKWAASGFKIIAILGLILAVLVLAGGAYYSFREHDRSDQSDLSVLSSLVTTHTTSGFESFIPYLVAAAGIALSAFILFAISNAITALRDIARNSWHVAFGSLPD
jgi:hypothetical protein